MSTYEWVKSDLDTLKEWSENLAENQPPVGSSISDEAYLQGNAIQIGIISQLEYFLKSQKKIEKQHEIPGIIEQSSLSKTEKENLKLLFLVRHTITHNGGHYDSKFMEECKKFTNIEFEGVKEGLLSSLPIELLPTYIDLVKKLTNEIANENN